MSIENIPLFDETIAVSAPTIGPRALELNPDLTVDEQSLVVAYSYGCTYCGAGIGEACIRIAETVADKPKRARFAHATRGTDYIPRAARQHYLDRTKALIIEAVDRIVADMTAEACLTPDTEELIEF